MTNVIGLKSKETNILYINKKCEKCGYIHTYEEVFRIENKYAVLHIMCSICPYCGNWNKFSLIIDENGEILIDRELAKYKIIERK